MGNYEDVFKKVIAHCKEYGCVFQSSEIYDGLSATYDYGPNGIELKNNIKTYWWKSMVNINENIVGLDAAIFIIYIQYYTLFLLNEPELPIHLDMIFNANNTTTRMNDAAQASSF